MEAKQLAVHQPHDKLFKKAFKQKAVVQDFLKSRLKADTLAQIDLSTLKLTDTSFITEDLRGRYTDVAFSVKIQGKPGYIYTLLEHQTEADEKMAIRLLEYNVGLMRQHLEAGYKKLPLILNLVLYAGQDPYPQSYPSRLLDAFETPALLYRMFSETFLIELNAEDTKKIEKDGKAALAELILREGHRRDFCSFLRNHPIIGLLLNDSPFGTAVILYMLSRDPHRAEQVLQEIRNLDPKKKGVIMNALQRLRNEGMQQGIQQGMQQGIQQGMQTRNIEIAKSLLSKQLDRAFIAQVTGLSEEALQAL